MNINLIMALRNCIILFSIFLSFGCKNNINQSFFEIEQQRMKTPEFIERMKERMWKVEGINAEAKNLHALKRVKYRGLPKVQIQAYMTGAVQNLKRLIHATIIDILRSIWPSSHKPSKFPTKCLGV
jgi:hypothetical protein